MSSSNAAGADGVKKRAYNRKDKSPSTIASLNKKIEAKQLELKAIHAEIEILTIKRNELYVKESAGMGLLEMIADPEKAKWLAGMVKSGKDFKINGGSV